jgi:hypothetical protein
MNEKLRGIMEKERVMISKRDESLHLQTGAWKRRKTRLTCKAVNNIQKALHVRLKKAG